MNKWPNHALALKICFQLGALIEAGELLRRKNLNDISVKSEDYIIPLLNWIYNINLENSNSLDPNKEGYDLECTEAYFQVTGQVGPGKIEGTIKKTNKIRKPNDNRPLYMMFLVQEYNPKSSESVDDYLSKRNNITETIKKYTDNKCKSKNNSAFILDAVHLYDKIQNKLSSSEVSCDILSNKLVMKKKGGISA